MPPAENQTLSSAAAPARQVTVAQAGPGAIPGAAANQAPQESVANASAADRRKASHRDDEEVADMPIDLMERLQLHTKRRRRRLDEADGVEWAQQLRDTVVNGGSHEELAGGTSSLDVAATLHEEPLQPQPLTPLNLSYFAEQRLSLDEKIDRWCAVTDFFRPQPPPRVINQDTVAQGAAQQRLSAEDKERLIQSVRQRNNNMTRKNSNSGSGVMVVRNPAARLATVPHVRMPDAAAADGGNEDVKASHPRKDSAAEEPLDSNDQLHKPWLRDTADGVPLKANDLSTTRLVLSSKTEADERFYPTKIAVTSDAQDAFVELPANSRTMNGRRLSGSLKGMGPKRASTRSFQLAPNNEGESNRFTRV